MTQHRYSTHWQTINGTPLHLRHVRPDDAERLRLSLDKLSPEARRQRFLAPVSTISDAFVRDLTESPRERQCTLLVLRRDGDEEIPVAGGRFVVGDTPETAGTCEFALTIGDAWQGQGIGRRLLRALIDEAEARGLHRMMGHILLDNRAMLALARQQHFTIDINPDDAQTRLAILDLPRRKPVGSPGILGRLTRLFGRCRR